jgi:hypothetical protein
MRLGHNSQACSVQWGESGAFSARACRPSGAGVADSVKGDARDCRSSGAGVADSVKGDVRECRPFGVGVADSVRGDAHMYASR